MYKKYQKPEKFNSIQLHNLIDKLAIKGFGGVGSQQGEIFVVFENRNELTNSEQKKLDAVFKNYIYVPELSDIRHLRKPLLEEADWRINRAEDLGEDTTELRKYRQALRDITLIENTSLLEWPQKPWL